MRAEARRASHQKQVMTAELEPAVKKAQIERPEIWFSDRDLDGVQLPHNDPLVLTLKLKNFLVQRVLVDPGSSSEIRYYDCFKKMGLKDEDLQAARTPLVGRISLRIQVGGASMQADFLVSMSHPHTM